MCPLNPGAFRRRSNCSRDPSLNCGRSLASVSSLNSAAETGALCMTSNPKPAEPSVTSADRRPIDLFENIASMITRPCRPDTLEQGVEVDFAIGLGLVFGVAVWVFLKSRRNSQIKARVNRNTNGGGQGWPPYRGVSLRQRER